MVIYLALVINEKDGTVQFQNITPVGAGAVVPQAAPLIAQQIEPQADKPAPEGPTESDVRAALLAAVKATDKATAVGVLETIAQVSRVPDVSAELRVAVIEALKALVKP